MAESQRMTTPEVVAETLIAEHSDFLREAVAAVAAQIMEAEISTEIGAGRGEVSPGRTTRRNGYRPRPWETRVGEIELAIPRKRSGEAYFPSFLEPRKRSEQAIVSVVMEAYVNGVSTRKVDRLVEQLGIGAMSKDRVSAICRGLDEQVQAFRERPLEGAYPYLWLDAKVLKVRDRGHVYPKALVIAYGVHESGRREMIGLDLGEVESGAFWVEFLRGLVARGLRGVRLCVSDEHQGLKAAIARVLACPWQRCTGWIQSVLATPDRGGCDEQVEGAVVRADGAGCEGLGGPSGGGSPREPSTVLGRRRERALQPGGRRRGRRPARGRQPVVPRGWRHADRHAGLALGSVPLARRARGDRDPARRRSRGAGDRPPTRPLAVDDLQGAGPQRPCPRRLPRHGRAVARRAARTATEGREARGEREAARLRAGAARRPGPPARRRGGARAGGQGMEGPQQAAPRGPQVGEGVEP